MKFIFYPCIPYERTEFPDAVIEAEQREISAQEGTETAAVTYIFTANIAAPP